VCLLLPQRLMVSCTNLGNGAHPCKHVVCTKVTCDLWLQPTQSLTWPERAPSTKLCALRALDSPHRGDLSINILLIPMSLKDHRSSRTLCSRHRNYAWCSPSTTATSHSSQYLQELGRGQGKISRTPHITATHSGFTAPIAYQPTPHGGAEGLRWRTRGGE